MIQIIFVVFAALLLYIYVGYPLGMRLLARAYAKTDSIAPDREKIGSVRVSVVAAAFNEEAVIRNCLDALFQLEYPRENIEFLVGSDGSTDSTVAIATSYSANHPQLRFFAFDLQRGKIAVLNDLVEQATGEILFFVDADVEIESHALNYHLGHYCDPEVGGVAGGMKYIHAGAGNTLMSEQGYQSFDEKLKQAESDLGATIGLFGANYSMRRSLWSSLPSPFVHDDFYAVLTMLDQCKRIIFEPRAVAIEHYARSGADEFKRKARFASRGLFTLSFYSKLLNPMRGRIAVMLWSHKILRWLTPYILLVLFCATVGAAFFGHSSVAVVLFSLEMAFVVAAILGMASQRSQNPLAILQHAWWFSLMNLAFAVGVFRYVFGLDRRLWAKSTRPESTRNNPYTTGSREVPIA